jgi:hypothetical protein
VEMFYTRDNRWALGEGEECEGCTVQRVTLS